VEITKTYSWTWWKLIIGKYIGTDVRLRWELLHKLPAGVYENTYWRIVGYRGHFTFRSTANSVRELALRGRVLNAASPSGTRADNVESGTVSLLVTSTGWHLTKRPMHCVILWSIGRPHLSSNRSRGLWQILAATPSSEAGRNGEKCRLILPTTNL
jgi:hypothetical protein